MRRSLRLGAYFQPTEFHSYLESVQVAEASGYAHAWITRAQTIWEDRAHHPRPRGDKPAGVRDCGDQRCDAPYHHRR